MAEILQYKCVKNDNKPFLFLDHPVPQEWAAAQQACQVLINAIRELCDTVEISESEMLFAKTCNDTNSMSKFILGVAMIEMDHTFAVKQFEVYHDVTFSHSRQEV